MMKLIFKTLIVLFAFVIIGKAVSADEEGVLIKVTSNEITVGALLDSVPQPLRDLYSNYILSQSDSFWIARAKKQIRLTVNRLLFGAQNGDDPYGTGLPDPYSSPDSVEYTFTTQAARTTISGRPYVSRNYKISTILVGALNTTTLFNPEFELPGDEQHIHINLPVDPYLFFQRTKYACSSEYFFPRGSVDAERFEYFFDDSCTVEPPFQGTFCDRCHCYEVATEDCSTALDREGKTGLNLTFLFLEWNETIAQDCEKKNIYSIDSNKSGADLFGYNKDLISNFIVYRYYGDSSCEKKECISASGWRKLLLFDATTLNIGPFDMNIGQVNYVKGNETSFYPLGLHNLYYWDACHNHPHFSAFGDFSVVDPVRIGGHKQGFCIQSVQRLINSRFVPFISSHLSCENQGVNPGWGDTYQAGTPCNWVDITDIDVGTNPLTVVLQDHSNPKGWLCEGKIVYNKTTGEPEWVSTGETTTSPPYPTAGQPIDTYKCEVTPGALDNNVDEGNVTLPLPGQTIITSQCQEKGQVFGPLRDCEFNLLSQARECRPGKNVTLRCSIDEKKTFQVLRICESSRGLGNIGTGCRVQDDFLLANEVITPGVEKEITFTCPSKRDSVEIGGLYSLYYGAVLNGLTLDSPVNCYPVHVRDNDNKPEKTIINFYIN